MLLCRANTVKQLGNIAQKFLQMNLVYRSLSETIKNAKQLVLETRRS